MFLLSGSLVIPHVTDAIQEWVQKVATVPVDGSGLMPQVCIIEVCVISVFYAVSVRKLVDCSLEIVSLLQSSCLVIVRSLEF